MENILNFISVYWLYILLGIFVIVCFVGIVIANTSIDKYYKVLNEYKNKYLCNNCTGFEFAKMISDKYFYGEIKCKIEQKEKLGTDGCYNPSDATVAISDEIMLSNSFASIAIIAHEYGHAKQHVANPQMLIKNEKLHQFVKFLGFLTVFLIIFALTMMLFDKLVLAIVSVCVVVVNFTVALFYKYRKIKIEDNASKNAVQMIEDLNLFSQKEINDIKTFLKYAKKTYVGDFFRSLFYWTGLVRKTKLF